MPRKKTLKWIVIAAIAVIGIVIIALAVLNRPSRRAAKLLDLGQQYLSDGEYEQAIAAFEEVLTIDPANSGTAKEMTDIYLVWAESYIESGKVDDAIQLLHEGHAKTKDARLLDQIAELEADKEE